MNFKSVSGKVIVSVATTVFVIALGTVAFSMTFSNEGGVSVASVASAWSDGSSGGCCGGGGGRDNDRDNDREKKKPKPSCDISANPDKIQSGDFSVLTWTSKNASSATLSSIGSVGTSGTFTVVPTLTTTYTLTVKGSGGTATCKTTVVVENPVPACNISANPNVIQHGGSSTLTWSSTNATSATINQGIGNVALSGSTSVSPSVTTTYTMTVTGPGGTANCQTFVTVQEVPNAPLCTISANPNNVQHGGSSTLTWSSSNATSASLSGHGTVALNDSHAEHNLTSNTTFTLTVTGPGGTANCQTTITVQQAQTPSCTISANPSSIQTGGSSYLTWSSSNAVSATLTNFGNVGVNGNQTVYPLHTTTYTLTVYNAQGQSAQCQTTVTVSTIPFQNPPSCWITLTPQYGYGSYNYNQQATLTWGSNNATSAYISPLIGSVPTSGSRTVYTDGYVMYTMTVYNAQGQSATCQTQTQVIPPPPVYPPQITLTQIPYTGLDLGTVGTMAYYFSILAFALAASYLAVYYLPMFAGIKARVPAPVMEAPMQFAKSVAASIPLRVPSSTKLALGSLTKDAMTFIRSENGKAPRIVIARS
ncbi:hypothetical protein C4556_00095 [Candidatus Parcubacteria bacterium]|nr:MAG: hypothetical protein C4556_00095 [Candidatus Parcubacteria bacterium]